MVLLITTFRGFLNTILQNDVRVVFVYLDNRIAKGVITVKFTKDMIAWIKLDSHFFGWKDDIYVAILYFVPEGPTYSTDDHFAILQNDIAELSDMCQFLACGDYNSHTNMSFDYDVDDICGNSGELECILPHSYIL